MIALDPSNELKTTCDDPYEVLKFRIENGTVQIGIIGMGYVGLPLALAFAAKGVTVRGFDIDRTKIAQLRRAESYIRHIPSAALSRVGDRLRATHHFGRLSEPDVLLICVPTPLSQTRDPDLSHVKGAAQAIASRLRPGQLIVLESTTYPGTTRQVVLPILESTGLRAGRDFFLAYSPEREDPGNPAHTAAQIPKVVGGLEERSLELAAALYSRAVVEVVKVSALEVAEACKILENTYRAVNIALVNELKVLYDRMGIDVWEVIAAARTKPFGFQAFYPGPGLGGHCIPIDPFYLTWIARKFGMATRFIELAGEINTSMPDYVINRITAALNEMGKPLKGSRIVLLGMAYKKELDDLRESPGLDLLERLLSKGACVEFNDPHIATLPRARRLPEFCHESRTLTEDYLRSCDCVVIVTDHAAYRWPWIVEHSKLVVDTRNATQGLEALGARIIKA
jgi:UDP-N-acetyl-D-glucosamine dehydrogenase